MNKNFCVIALLSICILGFSSENPMIEKIENARSLGYQYNIQNETEKAIECYQIILELDPNDYDARLALGRLYTSIENFTQAEDIFQQIIKDDSTDLEAYTGLAKIASMQDNFLVQILYLNKIIDNFPSDISTKYKIDKLYQLALVYQYSDQLSLSNQVLDRIINIEPTFAEAWAEKGKLAYWNDKPYLALNFYEKAIELDSVHLPYQAQKKNISAIVKLNFYTKHSYVREKEDNLEFNHYQHTYRIVKRLSNSWETNLAYHNKYTHKNSDGYKSNALYDNYVWNNRLNINQDHIIRTNLGYSGSEKLLSLADLNLQDNFRFGKFSISNNLTIKSEYFETWYGVSHQLLIEKFSLSYEKTRFSLSYQSGKIDNNYVENGSIMRENMFLVYTAELNHEIYKNLNIGINYKFQDFEYESGLYYTPQDKKLYGINASYFFDLSDFYSYISSSVQMYEFENIETNNSIEFGYDWDCISLAISYANSQTPYYQSDSANIILRGHF